MFPRAATVRISALATAFLTGTTAISLLVAPAAGAAALSSTTASSTNQSVATTWGHDDKRHDDKRNESSWNKWQKPSTRTPVSNETKTVAWLMPKSTTAEVSWPQEYAGTVPACGTGWYQVDVYRYGTPEQKKLVDEIISDGILTGPEEDGKAYVSHTFVQPVNDPATGNPTPEPTPEPTPVPEVPEEEIPETEETPNPEVPVEETPAPEVPVEETPAPEETPVPEVPAAPVEPVVVVETPAVTPPVAGVGGAYGAVPAPAVVPPVSGTTTQAVAVEDQDGVLAATGAKVGLLSALAAAFIAAGIVAFRISRRAQAAK
jgi:hypothetical protein